MKKRQSVCIIIKKEEKLNHTNGNLLAYDIYTPVHHIAPDRKSNYDVSQMGGYKLSSFECFDYIVSIVEAAGLMGKAYSTDESNPYVCTTFVSEVLSLLSIQKNQYLPGGQKVIDSIAILGDLIESNGKNPSEGTYLFYYDYGDGTGHTGFVRFDKDRNAEILHNGRDGKGSQCVNRRSRDSRDFSSWFGNGETGKLYYKKFEVDLWLE